MQARLLADPAAQQADLQPQQIEAGVDGLQSLQLGGGVAGDHQAFQQVVEAGDQAITEGEAMLGSPPAPCTQRGTRNNDKAGGF